MAKGQPQFMIVTNLLADDSFRENNCQAQHNLNFISCDEAFGCLNDLFNFCISQKEFLTCLHTTDDL